jgi:hypothetical protein
MEEKVEKKKRPAKYQTETVTFLSTFVSGLAIRLPEPFPKEIILLLAAPIGYFTQFVWVRLYRFLDLRLFTYRIKTYIKELEDERCKQGKSKVRQIEIDKEISDYRVALKKKRVEELDMDV